MDKINEVVKNTLLALKKQSLKVTPDNYFIEFYKQSKKIGFESKEIILFDEIINEYNLESKPVSNFTALIEILLKTHKDNLKKLSYEFNEILTPSINFDIEDDIEELINSLSKNPEKILKRSTFNHLKSLTKQRISNDRKALRQKSEDIIKLTSLVSKQFETTIVNSSNSEDELSVIKAELEKLEISESSLREMNLLQTKLIDTVNDLEKTIDNHKLTLLKEKNNFSILEEKFIDLQKELKTSEDEKRTDYLTNILNRRAFDTEIVKTEKKFNTFGSKYAVVFYDIDHFKKINDTHGHDCGDAVLRTFAAILQNLTRQEDTVSRYGGEEFVVILNYIKPKEIVKYIKRVKELVKNSDFVYKNNDLEIKFSAGVAFRDLHNDEKEAIHRADELLYKAKNSGRDKVILDDGTII